jgi:hypothetical protein
MARPEAEAVCLVCGNAQFGELQEAPPAELADRLIYESRFDVAYACLEDLVSRGEETAWGCRALAWMSYAFQDLRAVETWSHESIRLEEESPEPHILLAFVLDKASRWAEAVEEFDIALRNSELEEGRRKMLYGLRARSHSKIPEF